MPNFCIKVQQIQFRLGLGGGLQRSPTTS